MEVLSLEAVCPRLLEVIASDIQHNAVDHLATAYVEDHLVGVHLEVINWIFERHYQLLALYYFISGNNVDVPGCNTVQNCRMVPQKICRTFIQSGVPAEECKNELKEECEYNQVC